MTLERVLDEFRNDKTWNTENKDGTHRFDEKIKWIEKMVKEYAEYFNLSVDDVITKLEEDRTYSWPNYYQEANFNNVSDFGNLLGIYNTFDDFNNYAKENWNGFKCPRCGSIGSHPQLCIHRLNKDGICDWSASGFITSKDGVIILENGFKRIPIFEPINKHFVR